MSRVVHYSNSAVDTSGTATARHVGEWGTTAEDHRRRSDGGQRQEKKEDELEAAAMGMPRRNSPEPTPAYFVIDNA
jgi:hypothetical protein